MNKELAASQLEQHYSLIKSPFLFDQYLSFSKKLDKRNIICSLRSLVKYQRKEVKAGQLIKVVTFDESIINGIITEVRYEFEECSVYLSTDLNENIEKIYWKKWWNFPISFVYILSFDGLIESEGSTANFLGFTNVPKTSNTLQVKWSLLYEDKVIINGLDWKKAGYCTFQKTGYKFKEGNYIFKAKRYNKNLTSIIADNSYHFTLYNPSEEITIGTLNSIFPPLNLS